MIHRERDTISTHRLASIRNTHVYTGTEGGGLEMNEVEISNTYDAAEPLRTATFESPNYRRSWGRKAITALAAGQSYYQYRGLL